ncbi:MAG: DUF3795 domain-containing protein [Dehalococcoidales bacterium]
MKEKDIVYCGLVCSECSAYIATVKNDDNLRRATAERWAKQYNIPVMKTSAINCTGCVTKGVQMGHCATCQIRTCAEEKGLQNCGYCVTYPCAKLEMVIKHYPAARKTLDAIKEGKK